MKNSAIADWLLELGSKVPTPGGGAVAGLNAAIAAAVLKMVCEYSIGPKFEENEALMRQASEKLAGLMEEALAEFENDSAAYAKLREAFALAKDSPNRVAAIQTALEAAVKPAMKTIELTEEIIEITQQIIDKSNKNLISDVAVSLSSSKAGLEAAIVNIEINLSLVTDPSLKNALEASVTQAETLVGKASQLFEAARRKQKEGS